MKIVSPLEMRNLEKGAQEEYGQSPELLMDEAAQAAFRLINNKYKNYNTFLILCGPGNNGGDGLALACLLGKRAIICPVSGDPEEGTLGALHIGNCREMGIQEWSVEKFLDSNLEGFLIVDALLGTGLNRDVTDVLEKVINKINSSSLPVLSLDIPSGINGLTGRIMGTAVRAERTITFGLPKGGNLLYPGFSLGGELFLNSLGISSDLIIRTHAYMALSEPPELPEREETFHKGSMGHLAVIGGSARYTGAPRFAAEAFLRSGGGFVHMLIPRGAVLPVTIGIPEAVLHPQEESEAGSLSLNNKESILKICQTMSMGVFGPGLGREEESGALFRELLASLNIPLIIDGDGLTHLAGYENLVRNRGVWLLPHAGEMSRLLDCSIQEILNNPVNAVREAVNRYDCPVLLKGPHSLMADREGPVFMNSTGNSSLATAGSGDILCGVLASCFGYGLKGIDALKTAVFIHGLAGEKAGEKLGRDSVLARDILASLPDAVREYRDYRSSIDRHREKMIQNL
jgi:hydroxyethylthiazole kinase-like uncharacterized protein yjeF